MSYKIDIDRCTIVKREGRFVYVGAPPGTVGLDWPTTFEDKRSGEVVFRSNEIMEGVIADTFGGYAKYEVVGEVKDEGHGMPVDMTRFTVSRTFNYRNEVVYIFVDGTYQVFAEGRYVKDSSREEHIVWLTVSEPCKIGNAP